MREAARLYRYVTRVAMLVAAFGDKRYLRTKVANTSPRGRRVRRPRRARLLTDLNMRSRGLSASATGQSPAQPFGCPPLRSTAAESRRARAGPAALRRGGASRVFLNQHDREGEGLHG